MTKTIISTLLLSTVVFSANNSVDTNKTHSPFIIIGKQTACSQTGKTPAEIDKCRNVVQKQKSTKAACHTCPSCNTSKCKTCNKCHKCNSNSCNSCPGKK